MPKIIKAKYSYGLAVIQDNDFQKMSFEAKSKEVDKP
jgi:hypothetical protein